MVSIDYFTGMHFYLSNFYEHRIKYGGWEWKSTEHAYQAYKTINMNERIIVKNADTPGESKKFGRLVTIRPNWEDIKIGVMMGILRAKFSDPTLSRYLCETGPLDLIEGNNWHDTYWGYCDGTCKHGPHTPVGGNMLGRCLKKVRKELMLEFDYGVR